ncbi:MAG: hypothetical protein H6760_01345 [Candidatus Nomurabacteria bacterium]|nr:MAG: hypothetical protein H6760_01345 [Candidatus Nomurabacteria bacterium]
MSIAFTPTELILLGGFLVWIMAQIYAPMKGRRKAVSFGAIEIVFLLVGLAVLLLGAITLAQNPAF